MSNLPESVLLLSLIIKTRPFTVDENNIITSTFTEEVSIQSLKDIKKSLEELRDSLTEDGPEKDILSRQYSDDLYMLEYAIIELESK